MVRVETCIHPWLILSAAMHVDRDHVVSGLMFAFASFNLGVKYTIVVS
jgi:hypothetical protein